MSGTIYIHEQDDWPKFRWNEVLINRQLSSSRLRQGKLIGRMESLGISLRSEAVLRTLTEDVLKTSEIEGEILDPDQVRSSLARRLGIDIGALAPADRDVEGVVEMMLDATQNYAKPLDQERLFGWHAALFPAGRSGMTRIIAGNWRDGSDGAMKVVSGPIGRERIHFEAPGASQVPAEMNAFLDWYNSDMRLDGVLKAALAHLWFVTIHPFADGNGRIARAIADMSLAGSEESPNRFYSMSAQIRIERSDYYNSLESTQKGDLDITQWLTWFLDCLDHALVGTETILATVLRRANFWKKHASADLNARQKLMLDKLLDSFEGKLNSSRWAKITKSSQPTAGRDIEQLIALDILHKNPGGGRSTSYSLNEE